MPTRMDMTVFEQQLKLRLRISVRMYTFCSITTRSETSNGGEEIPDTSLVTCNARELFAPAHSKRPILEA